MITIHAVNNSFQWFFGAVQDTQSPQITRCESDLGWFSPDHDAQQDLVNISFSAQDDTSLQLAMLEITDANLTVIQRMVWRQNQNHGQIGWDGRDITGSIVKNGIYQYRLKVYDQATNASPVCSGSIGLQAALDLADFP